MRLGLVVVAVGIAALLSGCAGARLVVEEFPIEAERGEPSSVPVPIYEAGLVQPPRAGIPIARIGAHGNAYANKTFLLDSMAKRAAKMGADFVVFVGTEVQQSASYTYYSYYSAYSTPIRTMSAYGIAFVYSPIWIGMHWSEDFEVIDVVPGSPAGRAGVRIGDRILSVNGDRVSGDALAISRVHAKAKPGDTLTIELVNEAHDVRTVRVIAAPNSG